MNANAQIDAVDEDIDHTDGDGCAIYTPEYTVRLADGTMVEVQDLNPGDVFEEYDKMWIVNEVATDPDDSDSLHVDLEEYTDQD